MNENVKLTTDLFNTEVVTLSQYFEKEFGMEIRRARTEVKNIDESIKNLMKSIDTFF